MAFWSDATVHAFIGRRFDDGAIDVEVVGELTAYRALVLDVAEAIWRVNNSGRQRLPKNFGQDFRLRLSRLDRGCALATLQRSHEDPQAVLDLADADIFKAAMSRISEAVRAAANGEPLPNGFPRSSLPKFRRWGLSLAEDEAIELRDPDGATKATYTQEVRAELLGRIVAHHEGPASFSGVVLAASVRSQRFELYPASGFGDGVDVPMPAEHEHLVLAALAQHDEMRLQVIGTGAFDAHDKIVRFTKVDTVCAHSLRPVDHGDLWSTIDEISASVPSKLWDDVPRDGAENHNSYI